MGLTNLPKPGHYKAEEFITDLKKYESHDSLKIYISVDVNLPFSAPLGPLYTHPY